ncbi:MAG: tyrosine-type recombinase/integrase [Bacteroidetes bacterium]|nr:tyrosine-type recombinase/integrase [Bacteroidota bacterium]
MEVEHVKLREGTIYVPGSRKSNSRELQLQAHQVIDIMDYINETRKLILAVAGKESNKLFVSLGEGSHFRSIADKLTRTLRKQDSRIKDMKQFRASVIVHWLKHYNLRKVQYLAGHRYISSTEKYQANNLEDLQEEISKYHPIG